MFDRMVDFAKDGGQPKLALQLVRAGLAISPAASELLDELKELDPAGYVDHLRAQALLSPRDDELLTRLTEEDPHTVLAIVREGLRKKPGDEGLLGRLTGLDPAAAVTALELALTGDPDDDDLMNLLTSAGRAIGQERRALPWIERALARKPTGRNLAWLISSLLEVDPAAALPRFVEADRRVPVRNTSLLTGVAKVLLEKGDTARGLKLLRRAYRIEPDSDHLEDVFEVSFAAAATLLEEQMRVDPADWNLREQWIRAHLEHDQADALLPWLRTWEQTASTQQLQEVSGILEEHGDDLAPVILRLTRKALARNPWDTDLIQALVDRDCREGLAVVLERLGRRPGSATLRAVLRYGLRSLAADHPDRLLKMVAANPREPLFRRARFLSDLSEYCDHGEPRGKAAARKLLKRSIRLDPKNESYAEALRELDE